MDSFNDIIGHREILNILSSALSCDRITHAYLFEGPRGVGKGTMASVFAKTLLCSSPGENGPCNICRSCRQFLSGNHPDFYRVEPDGNYIKISQIRQLQQKMSLQPFQGTRQVFIIEEAETMTREAVNSFLKSLEEPPGSIVFILISHYPQLLLTTISSRCQQFNFKPLSNNEVIEGLKKITGLKEKECRLPSALAEGSLGAALESLNNSQERDELFNTLNVLENIKASEISLRSQKIIERKVNLQHIMDMLLMWYRDVLILKKMGQSDLIVNIDCNEAINKESKRFSVCELIQNIKAIEKAKTMLSSRVNNRLVLENLLLILAGIYTKRRF
ncbi:MAG: DNA polymerase III subunit delta' [Clostridiales bacterium]|nr:DNA polymerase III subunit delta' [Clostridiales bacterium]MCF8021538.1 DNA polymerase III subunit delta' [Clostridiales bacterium]